MIFLEYYDKLFVVSDDEIESEPKPPSPVPDTKSKGLHEDPLSWEIKILALFVLVLFILMYFYNSQKGKEGKGS
jgi:hypothetical protein